MEVPILELEDWYNMQRIANYATTKKLRNSYEYRIFKETVLERDNHSCKMCGSKGRVGSDPNSYWVLSAHHIYPIYDFVQLMFEVKNGITLCGVCHQEVNTDIEKYIPMLLELIGTKFKHKPRPTGNTLIPLMEMECLRRKKIRYKEKGKTCHIEYFYPR